jgi:hypothetical protein
MRMPGAVGIAFLALGVLTGCAGTGGGGGTSTPSQACKPPAGGATISYANNIQPIFTATCALPACHLPPAPGGGLDLTPSQSYGQLVGVKSTEQPKLFRVKKGAPDQSYLVQKIEGAPGISGGVMPLGCPTAMPCLTPDQMQAIRQWITECALNN